MANQKKGRADRKQKRLSEDEELSQLQRRIDEFDAAADGANATKFSDLPISGATLRGLTEANFVEMTEIQRKTLGAALKGDDVMGTAKTGSGKTLAFLVPVVEALVRQRVSEYDGLAALVISPTRELAVQIFEVLTRIGRHTTFSAGLVTGGKDVQYEKERVAHMNILVGTPGRLAQHLNETVGMDTANMQVLVLDEADRCLDMGFKKQVDSIVGHLPRTRQTLLFSATQSESVTDLARLSMANPRRIGVASDAAAPATPASLEQFYVRVALDAKLDLLWSFLKAHLKCKILVFFSSSKQVQYAYEAFRTLQPGISLMRLYGRHKQATRLETTAKFTHAHAACLFATDIVARGLDFPAIDWVVQVDCPEDAATYVHRAGRCARFGRPGKSLLMLVPSEEAAMLARLQGSGIAPRRMDIKAKNKKSIRPQLQALCFKDPKMKNLGQRAFIAYYKSVYVQRDKQVFDVGALPAEKYAESLGLPGAPQIKMGGTAASRDRKNASKKLLDLEQADADGDAAAAKKEVRTKYDRMFERQNQTVLSKEYLNMTGTQLRTAGAGEGEGESESEDDFMRVKRKDHAIVEDELPDMAAPASKRQAKKALSKKLSLGSKGLPTKLRFDDDGVAHALYELGDEADFKRQGDARTQKAQYVLRETEAMNDADTADKAVARAKRQDKKRKRKEMERKMREDDSSGDDGEPTVTLGGADLDRDLESSDEDDAPRSKQPKWFQKDVAPVQERNSGVVELAEPESLEDLEALTARLIGN